MNTPRDTSPEAERVLTEAYRRMSPAQKWLRLGKLYEEARMLHAAGVRLRNPAATRRDIHEAWMTVNLGFTRTDLIREPSMDQPVSSLREFRTFISVFERLGLPYALGGSMASSVHGIDRYTRDADVTLEPFPGKEAALAGAFGPDYYVSLPAIQEAVRKRSSFNIINTATGFKVDVFVRKDDPFERAAMSRRASLILPDAPDQPVVLYAPEDVILFKFLWYRLGNESSEQQWKDILGVFRAQGGKLDSGYLNHWAAELGVQDLLAKARLESGA